MDLETRNLYIKLAFEFLDLNNSNSFETSGLGCDNLCISNMVVANSVSGLPRVSYLGRGSKTRPRANLCWLNPHLKFITSIATALQLLCCCLDRILNLLHWSSLRLKFTTSTASSLTVLT